jgi:glycosyltransferase involved in cell wall biosynthesis
VGHDVTVLTGRRAYDRPWVQFSSRETYNGVRIIRIPNTGLGKAARWRRAMDFGSFIASCFFRMLRLPRFDVVISMTSPPLISSLAALMVAIRGGNLVCWVLDLNPDEAIAAGWLREDSFAGRFLKRASAFSFSAARKIVVMDRFMAKRVMAYGVPEEKIAVIPPWSHDGSVHYDPAGRDEFRHDNGLAGHFVVMYSGNHSPCHPLETLLEAARRMKNDSRVVFCFIGGGSEFARVKAYASGHRLRNILCLPYVPLSRLSASLSAADLHTVVMGEPFVGIVHTCKVYNALALGIPFLYIGPESSHIGDLIGTPSPAWMAHAEHGDVARVIRAITQAASSSFTAPRVAEQSIAKKFSQEALMPVMFKVLREAAEQVSPLVDSATTHIHSGPRR